MRKPGGDDAILHREREVDARSAFSVYGKTRLAAKLLGVLLFAATSAAQAIVIQLSSDVGVAGGSAHTAASVTSDGDNTTDVTFAINYDSANFTPASIIPQGGASCTQGTPGTIFVTASGGGMPLGAATLCDVYYNIGPTTPDGTYPVTVYMPFCNDTTTGMPTTCNAMGGSITVGQAGTLQCPQTAVSGGGQSGSVGTTLPQQLTAKAVITGATIQPSPELIIWQITTNNATFTANSGVFYTHSAPYVNVGGTTWEATDSVQVALGFTPGSVTVTATTEGCGTPEAMFTETIVADIPPTLAYNPAASSTVTFTGVVTPGGPGTGQIAVTPSGGSGAGETDVQNCAFSGGDATAFSVTSAQPLKFIGSTTTSQNIAMQCTSSPTIQLSSTLTCDEITIGGARPQGKGNRTAKRANATNSWPVVCPVAADAPPTVTYSPATGNNVFLNNGSGSVFASSDANGVGTSAQSTTTISNCSISGAGASVFGAPTLAPNPITFTGSTAGSGQINLTCTPQEFDTNATLTCDDRRGTAPAVPVTWPLTCGARPTSPPVLSFNPSNGSPVSFTGVTTPGTTGTGQIVVSPSGGSGNSGNSTTRLTNCAISGTDASAFTVTSALPLTFVGSSTASQNLDLACTSSSTVLNATLTCDENQSDFSPIPHNWPLSCPAGSNLVRTMSKVSGDGQSGAPGATLNPVSVQLFDSGVPQQARRQKAAAGTPSGVDVSFDITSGDATFANGTRSAVAQTDSVGVAASPQIKLGTSAGPVNVVASSTGYNSQTFNLTLSSLGTVRAVSGDNQVGQVNQAGQPLVIAVSDGNGQPLPNETVTWAVSSGSGVSLQTTNTVTDAQGNSQIGITFGPSPATATITATTSRGLTFTFHVRSQGQSVPPTLTLISGGNQRGPVGSLTDVPLVFEYLDSSSAPVVDVQVDVAVELGSATVTPASARTDTAGRVTIAVRYGPNAGPIRIAATSGNGIVRATANLTSFVPGFAPATGNNQSAPAGTKLPQPLVVSISNALGPQAKGLGTVTVNWTVLSGGGTLATATSTTNASGQASNEYTLGTTPGQNRVQATIAGVGSVVFTANATAPQNAQIEIVSGNNQDLAPNTDSAPLVVRVHTPDGAAVAGACVGWAGSTGVTVSSDSTTTGSDGRASITARVAQPGTSTVTANACQSTGVSPVTFQLNGALANVPTLSPQQQTVAGAIDNACPALFGRVQAGQTLTQEQQDLLARCSEVVADAGATPTAVATALDQMVADESQAQQIAAITATNVQFQNVTARLLALRNGVRGGSFNGLALANSSGVLPLSFLPSMILANAGDDDAKKDEVGKDFSRLGFFATGTIGHGKRDNTSQTPGFDFDTAGITAGVDYRYSDTFVFGVALGYNRNNTDITRDRGGLDVHGWSVSGYGTFYRGDSYYADLVASIGRNSFDLSRRIRYSITAVNGGVTNVDQVVKASPDGDQHSFGLSLGRDFNHGAWSFGPYGRLTYSRVGFDSYTERASDPNAPGAGLVVSVDGRDITSMQAVLGGKVSWTHSTSWGVLIPHVQGEWLHEFKDDPVRVVTYFANDPTRTPIVIPGERADPDYFNLGFGVSAVLPNGKSGFIYYEHRAGERRLTQDSIALGLRLEF